MSTDINQVISDATKSWTKEDHIAFLKSRVEARQRRMAELTESVKKMQEMNRRDLLRIEELRILRDIRDGKITLVDTNSGQPFDVRVVMPDGGSYNA